MKTLGTLGAVGRGGWTRNLSFAVWLGLTCVGKGLLGCTGSFESATRIERTRVVATRSSVIGDASRAWPRPGETVRFDLLAVDPNGIANISWALVLCADRGSAFGVGGCAGSPLALATQLDPQPSTPFLEAALPSAAELGAVTTLRLSAIACPGASLRPDILPTTNGVDALLDPAALQQACPVDERNRSTLVTATVSLQRDDLGNRRPLFQADTLLLNGAPWPELEAFSGSEVDPVCSLNAQGTVPTASARRGAVYVRSIFPADQRDVYLPPNGAAMQRESLRVSHFADAGQFNSQFSFIEGEADNSQVAWIPPEVTTPAAITLVRFYFVVRDQRGGVDWTRRYLCLVP